MSAAAKYGAASSSVMKLFSLAGKTALVTGASRGLGLQMAFALGEAGAKVLISSRKVEDLIESVKLLHHAGIDAQYIAGNCANEKDILMIAKESVDRLGGRVDILVNNAGATWGSPAESHDIDAWDKIMNLNIRGYFIMSKEIANLSMIPNKSGKIINMASIAGMGGNPKNLQMIAYNTSKGAVNNFTKTLGAEWGKYNINVNAICPGFFPTKMTKATLRLHGVENMTANVPLGRLGDDNDIKGLSVLLASDAGKHITGQCIAVDGGVSCVIGM
jgi:NAD(P)-dependent dehydrogenase (short-subunit alcohol dehydrogenase family)